MAGCFAGEARLAGIILGKWQGEVSSREGRARKGIGPDRLYCVGVEGRINICLYEQVFI
jgi:hypothetical protein